MALCCTTVSTGTLVMVERCGNFNRVAKPGLNCTCWAIGDCVAGTVSVRVQQLDVNVETKTKDNVFVTVVVSVQYQVIESQAYDAYYKLKDDIAKAVREELSKVLGGFGFMIHQALVTDIEPDIKVKSAMNEINAAQRMRVAAQDKAEADKIRIVKAAEADAESKHLQGVGISRQRQAIVDGLRESVTNFSQAITGTTPMDVMNLMMMTQYFDTLQEVGRSSKATTIFIPHEPGAVASVASQIRNGFLQGAEHGLAQSLAGGQGLSHEPMVRL
eukprot:jgi/Mesvir1/29305/Mv01566-RA.1